MLILCRMLDFSADTFDVIVCGAGPAGLKTAYDLLQKSEGKLSVLLLDRKVPWKEPVICAEAVSVNALAKYWTIKERFVRGPLSGVYFVAPNGAKAEFYRKNCGLQLNRAELHRDIFEAARDLGLVYNFETRCAGISRLESGLWNLQVEHQGSIMNFQAPVIVDGTGPGNKLTAKVEELAELEDGKTDLEPAAFAIAEGIEHSREHIELHFGSEFRSGYGWVFPRDGVEVNVGLVLGVSAKTEGISSRKALEDFIAKRYPKAKIKGFYGGLIACGQSKRPVAKLGVFKVGDAASCVNPISRSGIVEALKSGTCAATSILEWLATNDEGLKRKAEKLAFERWYALQGKTHKRIAEAKPAFGAIPDDRLNRAATRLSAIPRGKASLWKIFYEVLALSPTLIWKLRSFLRG